MTGNVGNVTVAQYHDTLKLTKITVRFAAMIWDWVPNDTIRSNYRSGTVNSNVKWMQSRSTSLQVSAAIVRIMLFIRAYAALQGAGSTCNRSNYANLLAIENETTTLSSSFSLLMMYNKRFFKYQIPTHNDVLLPSTYATVPFLTK